MKLSQIAICFYRGEMAGETVGCVVSGEGRRAFTGGRKIVDMEKLFNWRHMHTSETNIWMR